MTIKTPFYNDFSFIILYSTFKYISTAVGLCSLKSLSLAREYRLNNEKYIQDRVGVVGDKLSIVPGPRLERRDKIRKKYIMAIFLKTTGSGHGDL